MDGFQAPCTFAGIDVSKASLDVCVLPSQQRLHVDYDDHGIRQIVELLLPFKEGLLVVLEATGGYERRLVAELHQAGIRVAVVMPGRIRQFAKGIGQLAKNDRIDAQILAQYAQLANPRFTPIPSEKQAELQQLVTRRRQLIDLRTMENNRLETAFSKAARKSILKVREMLNKQIESIESQITKLMQSDDDWKHKVDILTSIPGVGPNTAHGLLAEMPELGQRNRQEIASLAGLAPFDRDSGPFRGKRSIRGGRAHARTTLYMAAFNAMRSNPVIRAFAQRLKAAGKTYKVILTACMRKLLVIINTLIQNNQPWNTQLAEINT